MKNKNTVQNEVADTALTQELTPKIKCGLIMPISKSQGVEPEHWVNVKAIVCEALSDAGLDVRLVSESDDVGVIHKSIVQNIYQNDIVICDVSTHNPNVMFELGLRLAFDKPTIIIKDDETPFSFDTQVIEHLVYKRSLHYHDIVSFKIKLKNKVLSTLEQSKEKGFSTFLKHFTISHVSTIDERTIGIDELFIERMEQMQQSINALSKNMYGAQLKENAGSQSGLSDEAKSRLDMHVGAYLEHYLSRLNISPEKIKEHLQCFSDDEIKSMVKGYYSFAGDIASNDGKKIAIYSPTYVRAALINRILNYK